MIWLHQVRPKDCRLALCDLSCTVCRFTDFKTTHHSWGGAGRVWYVVTAPFHISPVDQVSASTGDDVAAANVHSDSHHPVRGHTTAGRGHHCGDVTSTALRVKVVPPTALPIQLSFRVVGVGRSAGGKDQIRTHVGVLFYLYNNWSIVTLT